MLIKFILISILIIYAVYKVFGFFIRVLFQSMHQQQQQFYQERKAPPQKRKAKDSNLNIDYVPGEEKKQDGKIRGGDYVDYEEVK